MDKKENVIVKQKKIVSLLVLIFDFGEVKVI